MIEEISEIHVKVGTIISFLYLCLFKTLSIEIEIKFAVEPELTKVEYLTPSHLDHFFSNSPTFFD